MLFLVSSAHLTEEESACEPRLIFHYCCTMDLCVCVCLRMSIHLMCVCVHLDLYVQGLNSMCVCVCLQFHQCRVAASKILCASVNFFSALVWVCAQVWMQCMFAIISFSGQRLSLCPFWLITTAVHVPSLDLGTAYSTGHMSPVCFP